MNIPHHGYKDLHIVTRLNVGGPALHTILLVRGLPRLGYESTLAAGVCEAAEGDMSYLLDPGDRVRWIPEMSRSIKPWNNVRAVVRLWKLIRELRPDVVHTHTAMAGCLGRIAAFLAGAPVIVHTFHGNSLRGYFSPLANGVFVRIERLLAAITDTICVLSPQQLDELSGSFRIAPRSRFRVVPLGLDLTPFTAMPPPSPQGGRLRVGWFGRLVPVKNIPLLLAAIEETIARSDRIDFHVAGDGPERDSIINAAKRHGSRLVWHGWQRDIAPLVSQCDVLVQTSINEGTPVALIQGMAAARLFVSTAAGGVVDMVCGDARRADGCAWHSNGALVDPDPAAFARAVVELAEDPARINAMGAEARAFATERYNQDALLEELDTLYRGLLCGADPLVRSRPPGRLFCNALRPTRASAADQGVRPTK